MRFAKFLYRWPEFVRCMRIMRRWPYWMRVYVARQEKVFPDTLFTRQGLQFRLDDWSELSTAWRVLCANEYLVPKEATRIVDAGANIGTFSASISLANPSATILACEPFPSSHQHLIETIASNRLADRIVAKAVALAGKSGFATFDGRPQTRSYCRKLVDEQQPNAIQVPTMTLSQLLDEQGWDRADYLKMDIEGGEYDALLSLDAVQLRRFQAIGLEYHDATLAKQLFEHFKRCRFDCIRHLPAGWSGLAEFRQLP